MSRDWITDIKEMHRFYGHKKKVEAFDGPKLVQMLRFRNNFLMEEMRELQAATEEGNAEEVLDALIDLCVVAIGTMDLLDMDMEEAWDDVLRANMSKENGVKPSRPNPLGLPDLIKPPGWRGPDHTGRADVLLNSFGTVDGKLEDMAEKLQKIAVDYDLLTNDRHSFVSDHVKDIASRIKQIVSRKKLVDKDS